MQYKEYKEHGADVLENDKFKLVIRDEEVVGYLYDYAPLDGFMFVQKVSFISNGDKWFTGGSCALPSNIETARDHLTLYNECLSIVEDLIAEKEAE